MKNNTLLYIGAGLAAVYLITRQQNSRSTYLPAAPPASPKTTGWDVAGQAINILGTILPGLIGAGNRQSTGVGSVTQNSIDITPEFTDNGFMNWN